MLMMRSASFAAVVGVLVSLSLLTAARGAGAGGPSATVAYVEQYGEGRQMRVLAVEHGHDMRLREHTDCSAAWLHDGAVLFTSTPPGMRHDIAAVTVGSRALEHFTTAERGAGRAQYEAPALSPDGRQLAYAANRTHHNAIVGLMLDGERPAAGVPDAPAYSTHVYSTRMLGTVPMWVARLAWSPDGAHLLAEGIRENRYPAVYRISGGAAYPLEGARTAAWAGPDHIVYAAVREGVSDLFAWSLEEGREMRLTDDAAIDGAPVVSPDGMRIAYTSGDVDRREVRVLDAPWAVVHRAGRPGSNAPDRLTTAAFADIGVLAWSPDGTRLLMSARPAVTNVTRRLLVPYDLYTVGAEDGAVRRVRAGHGAYINNFSRFCAAAWAGQGG